jgi:hypothetical protein
MRRTLPSPRRSTEAYQTQYNQLYFEVQHPTCVSQITKLNSRRLKFKTQLYYTIYIANDGNNYMFRPLIGHHQVVRSMKRVEGRIVLVLSKHLSRIKKPYSNHGITSLNPCFRKNKSYSTKTPRKANFQALVQLSFILFLYPDFLYPVS